MPQPQNQKLLNNYISSGEPSKDNYAAFGVTLAEKQYATTDPSLLHHN